MDYPILSDPGKAVATAYGVVTPERQMPFRWTFYIGPDGKIIYVDREVKPSTHGEDVVARLKTLGVAPAKK